MGDGGWRVEHTAATGFLRAVEPTRAEVRAAAAQLAVYYNDPHNSTMMAHDGPLSVEDVVDFYDGAAAAGARRFLLYCGNALVGDADFRSIGGGSAEFAIMIGNRSLQGKGLGKTFAIMLHALGFSELGLERVYATFVPSNLVSMGLFEKLGYTVDDSPTARAFADAETDVSMSVDRARFRRLHENALLPLEIAKSH
jgi:RimJ/RimL family protein N-acetyltransferase